MSLIYLIDGYNLTNHPACIRQLNKKISDKRSALLDLIKTKRLTGSARNKVWVVFDGYGDDSDSVLFSRQESADERIRKLLDKCPNPKVTVVVSDDRQIKFFAKAKGAKPISVEEFFAVITRRQQRRASDEAAELKINYSQASKINQELKKLWLE